MALALAIATGGCGGDEPDGQRPRVVATTTQAADFARAVGGDRAEVHAMLRPGADPHGYEPRPSDVRALAEADLVVRAGGEIDDWLVEAIDVTSGEARTVILLDAAGGGDPHFWLDPRRVAPAVLALGRAFARADPASRAGYERRARAYVARVRRLDREIAECMRGVPRARRKVVTSHEAIEPFARRYGVEVAGTILGSSSTSAQPSAREVDRLVRRMRGERVRLVLPEGEEPTRLERAVAREANARIGPLFHIDSLAEGRSYLETMRANAAAVADGCPSGAG